MIRYEDVFHTDLRLCPRPRCLTAGVFDGVHLAHQRLVSRAVHAARPDGTSIVFTFANHPLSVLAPPYAPKLLITAESKARQLERLGIDVLVMPRFTRQLAELPPDRFIQEILVDRLGVDHVVVGFDFRFGAQGGGDTEYLASHAAAHGFGVEVIPPVREEEWIVSSTRVRELIDEGSVRDAAQLLGRPYEIEGLVVHGYGRGTQLGYPTANLAFDPGQALPPSGVYAVFVRIDGRIFGGMMNIGYNPTFDGTHYSPEVYLFDYAGGDLYDRTLSILFVQRIREERKFPSSRHLRERLAVDETMTRSILSAHPMESE